MGEILRHAEISHFVSTTLKGLNDEDFTYIELGNFLTDLTNFRDPYAFMSARLMVWNKVHQEVSGNLIMQLAPLAGALLGLGVSKLPKKNLTEQPLMFAGAAITKLFGPAIVEDLIDAVPWLDDLLGSVKPGRKRFGMAVQFLDMIAEAVTHSIFSNDVVNKDHIRARMVYGLRFGLPGSLPDLPADEVARMFQKHYLERQYFPHEHMDMPPYIRDQSKRIQNRLYRKQARGLIGYLEDQIQYLSEGFTQLEKDWKIIGASSADPQRKDLLVQLGRLLHAVEDYFFHSNYVEINLWNEFWNNGAQRDVQESDRKNLPYTILRKYAGYKGYDSDIYVSEINRIRNYRKLSRRLRFPNYERKDKASKTVSQTSVDMVYTGSFESKDIFHTISHALEGLGSVPGGGHFALIKAIKNEAVRTRMAEDEDYLKALQEEHKQEILNNEYDSYINELFALGIINSKGKNALLAAFSNDKRFTEEISGSLLGAGAFWLEFLAMAQREKIVNKQEQDVLDTRGFPTDPMELIMPTDNGASKELIGTHSLLSKDTPESQPLYEDALVLSKFSSYALATIVTNEINTSSDTTVGLNWDKIIRHYIRFPRASNAMWETRVLNHYRRKADTSEPIPALGDISDQPDLNNKLRLNDPDRLLLNRQQGTKKDELEKAYIKLEQETDFD